MIIMLETGNPDSIESTNVLFSPHARRGQKKGEIHEVKKSKCSFNVNVLSVAMRITFFSWASICARVNNAVSNTKSFFMVF